MELFTLIFFCTVLITCIASGIPVLYALSAGLFIFVFYAVKKGFSVREVLVMCARGIRTAGGVITAMLLIGVLTAMWRAAGTIPVIVCYAGTFVRPSVFLPAAFLINCFVSVVTGTSFGTAATMGVICAAIGESMQIPAMLTGGAVLSGIFFGDRCSPVSTSALLVAEITGTDIYDNLRSMVKTAALPFVIASVLYALTGLAVSPHPVSFDLTELFSKAFELHPIAVIPAFIIFMLSVFRVPVRRAMLASILSAVPLCILLQGNSAAELLSFAIYGYRTGVSEAAPLINGGGIVSMLKVSAIVCISSAYSGIFQKTELLDGVRSAMLSFSRGATAFGAILFTSVLTAMLTCNQTLSIILTKQLCEGTEPDRGKLAVNLENSAVIIPALVPWSIAGAVPLSTVNAPLSSMLFAFFLYILPLYTLAEEIIRAKKNS